MAIKSLSHSSLSDNRFYRSMLAGNEYYVPFTPADDILEEIVLASSASSVTFSGLDAYTDYQHLQIRMVGRSDRSSDDENLQIQFNGVTTASYANHFLQATTSVASGAEISNTGMWARNLTAASSAASAFSAFVIDILDFSSTSKNTTVRTLGGSTDQKFIALSSGAYFSTDAITSVELSTQFANDFVTGSRFSLIGVR